MANFGQLTLTTLGIQAQYNAQAGAALTFTRIAMGSGNYSGNIASLTGLVTENVSIAISSGYANTDAFIVEGFFSNEDLQKGFAWREIGLFIEDASGNEILYCYANAGDTYDYIPATTDERYTKYIRIATAIGNASNVTIAESSVPVYVDLATFNNSINTIELSITNISNEHRLKTFASFSDIGLSADDESIEAIATSMPSNSELLIMVGESNKSIYPQTYGILHVIKKDGTRTVFKFYSKTTAYEYLGIYDNSQTTKWSGWTFSLRDADVVDGIESTATKLPLSANQGRVLNSKIESHTSLKTNPHEVTKAQVGLGNVPNVATNDQTPTYSDTNTLATLTSGEKLNVALQKIKCAITNLINHINSHRVNTYTSFSEIGVTFGEETIDDIADKLPSNSELFVTVGADNAAIYPQTYGVLHVKKKDATRAIFEFYNKSIAYRYFGIYDNTITTKWTGWKYELTSDDIVNNLTSTATNLPLSANQGNILNGKLGGCTFSAESDGAYVSYTLGGETVKKKLGEPEIKVVSQTANYPTAGPSSEQTVTFSVEFDAIEGYHLAYAGITQMNTYNTNGTIQYVEFTNMQITENTVSWSVHTKRGSGGGTSSIVIQAVFIPV